MAKKANEDTVKEILQKFNQPLAQAINNDLVEFMKNSALDIKGPIMTNSAIQIKLSMKNNSLVAILREHDDVYLEKTYVEIDLLSDNYPKGSETKKMLDKIKKQLKNTK